MILPFLVNFTVVDALGLLAGALNIVSSVPQLWRALRAGVAAPAAHEPAQISSRALQLSSNLVWSCVGVLDSRIGLYVSCGISSVLLALLLWVLTQRR